MSAPEVVSQSSRSTQNSHHPSSLGIHDSDLPIHVAENDKLPFFMDKYYSIVYIHSSSSSSPHLLMYIEVEPASSVL
ncbi:hypothetical protein LEMLEM_LOCUS11898 [Lemmus lemmus]